MVPDASDLAQLYAEAVDIAQSVRQPVTTAHCLLALFTFENRAEVLLKERGIDEDRLLEVLAEAPSEPPDVQRSLPEKARELAKRVGSDEADCLHLLIALTGMKNALAYELLERCGVPLPQLRNTALSYYTGRMPRKLQNLKSPPRRPLGEATFGYGAPAPAPASPAAAPRPSAVAAPAVGERLPSPRPLPKPEDDEDAANDEWEIELPESRFPWLTELGRNLTKLASDGRLDPVVGREREIEEVIDILGKRRANNPMLIGEPGVGKTAVAEGVAQRLLAADEPEGERRIVVELDVASIVAGTQLRGSFSEKLNGIKDEVRRAGGRVVVFIDEIHTLIGAGSTGDGPQDAANELKAALARGEFPCIGATTHDEYRKFIQSDPALERRFTAVLVPEPTVPEAVAILRGVASHYEAHHHVRYAPEALEAAATLAARYLTDRCLPDKALSVIDQAGARARREGRDSVSTEDIARTVAKIAGLPEDRLVVGDSERLLRLEEELAARVVGHGEALAKVAAAIRRSSAGFHAGRPVGSFLFVGPTGVGKTELARALADVLYGTPGALVRLDMSEMSEAHAVARLVGAPPGYVGFGEPGQLTEPVRRRPSSVVLLDEIEKAHRDVTMLLLQVLEEGRLTDSRGRHIDFGNTVVILTTNLGAEAFAKAGGPVGFGGARAEGGAPSRALEATRRELAPELWNRIDEKIAFPPLTREQVARIADLLVAASSRRLEQERRIRYAVAPEAVEHLIDHGGFDAALGARPLRQTLQRLVEAPLAERILTGEISAGDRVLVALGAGALEFVKQP
ncbi:MAG TPA: ATP-dependent Clp protease ATP-binding subunit [Myxococcales bacterium]|nr:ATP-dependent Clp protease ATP-binding subunit [Myxococcales bacterium]